MTFGALNFPLLPVVVVVVGGVVGGGDEVEARLQDVSSPAEVGQGAGLAAKGRRLGLRLAEGGGQQQTADSREAHGADRCGAGPRRAVFIPPPASSGSCDLSEGYCPPPGHHISRKKGAEVSTWCQDSVVDVRFFL